MIEQTIGKAVFEEMKAVRDVNGAIIKVMPEMIPVILKKLKCRM